MVSAVRNDRGRRRLPAVRSIELVVYNFHRKSSNVCLFNFCYGIPCRVGATENAGVENAIRSKLQGRKMREWK